MSEIRTVNVDIPVGDGPVTKNNKVLQWFAAFGGFSGLAVFLVGVADLIPETVDPSWGLALTTASGVIAALGNFFTGKNRGQFAEAKARIVEASYYAPSDRSVSVVDDNLDFVFDTAIPEPEVEEALVPGGYDGPVVEPED